jgi:NagD protein
MTTPTNTTPAAVATPTNTTPTIAPAATEFASANETRDLAASFAASLGLQQQHTPHQNEDGISARDWALFRDPVLHTERLEAIRQKKGFIIDMDGVIYHVSF